MIVKAKKLILLFFILLKDLLEVRSVFSFLDISRSAVEAMTVDWCERLDEDSLLLTDDCLVVIVSATIIATKFILLNSHHNVIG